MLSQTPQLLKTTTTTTKQTTTNNNDKKKGRNVLVQIGAQKNEGEANNKQFLDEKLFNEATWIVTGEIRNNLPRILSKFELFSESFASETVSVITRVNQLITHLEDIVFHDGIQLNTQNHL